MRWWRRPRARPAPRRKPESTVTMPTHVPQKSKLELKPHQIILRPLVTEKGMHRSTRNNAYAFEVHVLATKADVQRRWKSCLTCPYCRSAPRPARASHGGRDSSLAIRAIGKRRL